jgi:hypothetical protein
MHWMHYDQEEKQHFKKLKAPQLRGFSLLLISEVSKNG